MESLPPHNDATQPLPNNHESSSNTSGTEENTALDIAEQHATPRDAGDYTNAMQESKAKTRYCQPYLVFAAPAADKQYGFNVGNGHFLCVRLRISS
jgi:hypothetical protein